MANPYAHAWWSNYSVNNDLPEKLKEAINVRMAAVKRNFTLHYMEAIMAELPEKLADRHEYPAAGFATDSEAPQSRIRAARARFNNALETQQLEGLGELLAPDYQSISGRGDRHQGLEAHTEMWRKTFEHDPTFNCQRTPEEINMNIDWGLAREVGSWLCTQTVEGSPAEYVGVYAAKWQTTENSQWVLQSEVFTTMTCDGPPAACRRPDPIAGY